MPKHYYNIKRNCLRCNKLFFAEAYQIKIGRGKYCSRSCSASHKKKKNPLKQERPCLVCGKKSWFYPSDIKYDGAKYCSRSCKGKRARLGKYHTEKTKNIMSLARLKNPTRIVGVDNNFWKGGITPINKRIRSSMESEHWRKAVFERDDFTCQWCKQKGGKLNADHIKPFSLYHELRFAIDNGKTLCINCHAWKTKMDMKLIKRKPLVLNYV